MAVDAVGTPHLEDPEEGSGSSGAAKDLKGGGNGPQDGGIGPEGGDHQLRGGPEASLESPPQVIEVWGQGAAHAPVDDDPLGIDDGGNGHQGQGDGIQDLADDPLGQLVAFPGGSKDPGGSRLSLAEEGGGGRAGEEFASPPGDGRPGGPVLEVTDAAPERLVELVGGEGEVAHLPGGVVVALDQAAVGHHGGADPRPNGDGDEVPHAPPVSPPGLGQGCQVHVVLHHHRDVQVSGEPGDDGEPLPLDVGAADGHPAGGVEDRRDADGGGEDREVASSGLLAEVGDGAKEGAVGVGLAVGGPEALGQDLSP